MDECYRKEILETWKEKGRLEKKSDKMPYEIARVEGAGGGQAIEKLHGMSFIDFLSREIAQQHTESKGENKKKINILDSGGGLGLYVDQLRSAVRQKTGHDLLRPFTTGLTKKPMQRMRRRLMARKNLEIPYLEEGINEENSAGHLKWRSLLELEKNSSTNLRERKTFKLIIDQYGEIYFGTDGKIDKLEHYLKTIIDNLEPGGLASIFPFGNYIEYNKQLNEYSRKELCFSASEIYNLLEKLRETNNVKIYLKKNGRDYVLQITKTA